MAVSLKENNWFFVTDQTPRIFAVLWNCLDSALSEVIWQTLYLKYRIWRCGLLPQGDQIGLIFAKCVIVSFGQFYENDRNKSHFWASFWHGYALILDKNILGYISGGFFASSSGHPAYWLQNLLNAADLTYIVPVKYTTDLVWHLPGGRYFDHNFLRFLTIFCENKLAFFS
jgi:hypothetical protein